MTLAQHQRLRVITILLVSLVLVVAKVVVFGASLPFDDSRRVPFVTDPAITLNGYDWAASADTNQLRVFSNGVHQPNLDEPNGVANVMLEAAWALQPHATGVIAAIIGEYDFNHAEEVESVIHATAPGVTVLRYWNGNSKEAVSRDITNAVESGAQIVCFAFDFNSGTPPWMVLEALTNYSDVMFLVSADNWPGEQRLIRNWMLRTRLPNVLGVNSFAKDGSRFWSAWGEAVWMGADGRRIIVQRGGTNYFASGTSYAMPRVAGALALLIARDCSPAQARDALARGADAWGTNTLAGRLNIWGALYAIDDPRRVRLALADGLNRIEWSTNLTDWLPFTLAIGPGEWSAPVGGEAQRFWRSTL